MRFLKSIILAVFLMAISSNSFAISYKRFFQDVKFRTQAAIEKQEFTNPAAAGTADILSANAGNTSAAAASATTFVAQPDVPRNLVITPGGTTADVAACTINVVGTDFHDESINEDFAFLANASTATTGSKAFKTVTTVSFPAACEDSPFGATWSVGYGEKLGLKRCLAVAGDILFSTVAGAKEGTAPTMAADAANIEGNTADFNGTMNGSNDFILYFIQNFAQGCQP